MPAQPHPLPDRELPQLRSFASSDRFIAEVNSPQLRAGYVLAGNETFLLDRCRYAVLDTLAPAETRDFSLHDVDLAETNLFDLLDHAQTPSLMAPFQVFFIRGMKSLYSRGSKKAEFAALDTYGRSPNPQALLIFFADHIHLPADLRRMDMQDRERFDRIRETLGDWCGLVELARVDERDAVKWVLHTATTQGAHIDEAAARELVDALGADMMLIASELEKLVLYVTASHTLLSRPDPERAKQVDGAAKRPAPSTTAAIPRITLGDVETMVLAAKQRSLYELTDAISSRDRTRAILLLHGLLNASDSGDDAAIGHLYMLARTFRQMLILLEKDVRDSRALWQVLWQGFRMPPFAADDLIRQARRYRSRRDLTRALRLIARADLDLRSSPTSKRLVLERLILALATEPKATTFDPHPQFAIEL